MKYDLAVIGAGWAGFNAAIKAKELGLKVALIEKGDIGGTCLNRGCIPTKALIQSAKIYTLAKKSVSFGIEIQSLRADFSQIQARKDQLIRQLRQGMAAMLKGVDLISAQARVVSQDALELNPGGPLKARFILIASGSRPMELGGALSFNSGNIISSDEILNLKEIPHSLLIIGGGVIGCEFACLFAALGTKVSIVEKMQQLLPGEDSEVAKKLENILKRKGVQVSLGQDAGALDFKAYEIVLLCIGRSANTEGLGLEDAGVNAQRGRILVDEYLRTSLPGIYAAGDCVAGKPMLAHAASYQGRLVAQNIVSSEPKEYGNPDIPGCIFTDPEIASVGFRNPAQENTEVYKFDFLGSAMARIMDEAAGFIKISIDKDTQEIACASIIGPKATELIAILTLAKSQHLKISQIRETIFAHPTLCESIFETLEKQGGV